MGVNIIFITLTFFLLFAAASSSMVELKSDWRPNFGWVVTCSWNLFANDSLQSVRLTNTDQQFMIYRPERDGSKRSALARLPNMELQADCSETQINGIAGKCVTSFEVFQPIMTDLSFTCDVSGERPMFRAESKTIKIEALVPPSDAVVETINDSEQSSGRVNVNCTSSGLPAPTLVWSIGGQKIPPDFTGSNWNFTSKLYHVWSSLSYTPVDSNSHATCTPETLRRGQLVKGLPATYNAANVVRSAVKVIVGVFIFLALTR